MISVERHALQASEACGVLRQALALPQVNGNALTPTGLLQENGAYRLIIDKHLGVHIFIIDLPLILRVASPLATHRSSQPNGR